MITAKQAERAARRYCEIMGIDPEAHIWGEYDADDKPRMRWQAEVEKIRAAWAMRQALAVVAFDPITIQEMEAEERAEMKDKKRRKR